MKNMSANFVNKVKASVKKYDYKALVSWTKEIAPPARFFTLDLSELDGGDILWSGNQEVLSFMDRYVYTDETNNCVSWKVSHKTSKHPWGMIQGKATLTLNNANGRYFPNNDPTIGSYVNKSKRAVTLQVGIDGEYLNLFRGFTGIPETSVVGSTCTLEAYDACCYIADLTSEHEPIVDQPLDYVLSELLLEAGFGIDQFVLEDSIQDNIGYVAPNGLKMETLINDLCEAEQYLLFCDGDGIIRGWNANHFKVTDTPSWTFDYGNATDMDWSSTNIINDVIVEGTPDKLVTGERFFTMDEPTDDHLVPANGEVEIWLSLKDTNDKTMYAVDYGDITYGVGAGSYYLTNVEKDGSGADNHEAITLKSAYNFGDTVKLTFANSSATDTYIIKISLFGDSAQQRTYVGDEQFDQQSIDDYGINPDDSSPGEVYFVESKYVESKEAAITLASRLVSRYSKPMNSIDITNFYVPHLELGDHVRVNLGATGENKECLVYGIDTSAGKNAKFTQKIYVEEKRRHNYFILDYSALDGGDVLAYLDE